MFNGIYVRLNIENVWLLETQIFKILDFKCTNEIIKIRRFDPRDTKMDKQPL